jgi:hypothetical protein
MLVCLIRIVRRSVEKSWRVKCASLERSLDNVVRFGSFATEVA